MDSKVTIIGDEELTAVSGGFCGTPPGRPGRRWKMPAGYAKSIEQSNTVGDIDVFAPGNKGDVTVVVEQSNTAS
jgi:hypothetical protein